MMAAVAANKRQKRTGSSVSNRKSSAVSYTHLVVAVVVLAAFIYLMVRPNKYADNNEVKLDTSRI